MSAAQQELSVGEQMVLMLIADEGGTAACTTTNGVFEQARRLRQKGLVAVEIPRARHAVLALTADGREAEARITGRAREVHEDCAAIESEMSR